MDVLYILGDKSENDNKELRLSLRSLEKNALDIERVFICGAKPEWIQNVEYIPEVDKYTRENNSFNKIMKICEETDISNDFFFMNDDFFMMEPFTCKGYFNFYCGEVKSINNPSRYQRIQNKTLFALEKLGIKKVHDFRVHCPIVYNKEKFIKLKKYLQEGLVSSLGYSHRLLYGNIYLDNSIFQKDCKLWNSEAITMNLQKCVSTSDGAEKVLLNLERIFNKPSKYEK